MKKQPENQDETIMVDDIYLKGHSAEIYDEHQKQVKDVIAPEPESTQEIAKQAELEKPVEGP
jgi:hypothetical protein